MSARRFITFSAETILSVRARSGLGTYSGSSVSAISSEVTFPSLAHGRYQRLPPRPQTSTLLGAVTSWIGDLL